MNNKWIKAMILDMDGVLWKADSAIGDLQSIFSRIKEAGIEVAFATNNGSRTPDQFVDKLASFGVHIDPFRIVTSSIALADLIFEHYPSACVYAIGEEGLLSALRSKGIRLVELEYAKKADVFAMGMDRKITFEKMCAGSLLVSRGVPFFSTNLDRTYPTPAGEIPGAGAWTSVIVTATGISPIYAGKPSPYILNLALSRLGYTTRETLVVGDRIDTDIIGAQRAGMFTALVLSGVSTLQEAKQLDEPINYIFRDLDSLVTSITR